MTSLIFMLFHPIFSFLANFILDAYGIRVGLNFGLLFTMLGAGTRLFINQNFGWVLLGQSLAAIGNPFITNAPAKIASNWFIPKNVQISPNDKLIFKESHCYDHPISINKSFRSSECRFSFIGHRFNRAYRC